MTEPTHPNGPTPLNSSGIDWQDGTPHSAVFGDVYFSKTDGVGETRHVFLGGIAAPDVWQNRKRFTIGELGFGTGLNVLVAWDAWRRTADPDARLHIVSVEGYPLEAAALVEAHAHFPEFSELSAQLRAGYPRRVPGFHRLRLDGGRVALTLLFGPVAQMLANLDGIVDAWFLDGFAPSRNPEMWSDAVFDELARLSAPGARVATFSAAGAVRRGLAAAGFEVEKRAGFGSKRECLAGLFSGGGERAEAEPWYARPELVAPGARVAVIGGGIAGRAASEALANEGFIPTVFDEGQDRAQPDRVLISPRLAGPGDAYGRFMAQAFVHAERTAALPPACGALHLPGEDEVDRMTEFSRRFGWPEDLARPVDAGEASDIAGLSVARRGIWFPTARFARAGDVAAATVRQDRITGLARDGTGWVLRSAAGGDEVWDAVVVAAGPWAPMLAPGAGLDVRANRGQLCYLPATARSRGLRLPVSFGGHLSPMTGTGEGPMHVLGSTYERWDLNANPGGWRDLRRKDLDSTLARLADVFPDLAEGWRAGPLQGWSGLRATTPDHLPVAGPLGDAAAYGDVYADLRHGRQDDWPSAPYLGGGYILSGLGSRGYQTAFLTAELIASQMAGAPLPVDREVAAALHPARFLVRALRRGMEAPGDHIIG